MQAADKLRKAARNLQTIRKWHRVVTLYFLVFILLMSLTGIMLGWKKHIHYFQAPTVKGISSEPSQWLSLDSINKLALLHAPDGSSGIDRIDLRPSKGMAKILFEGTYRAVQIDLSTGELLQTEMRRSDFIEQLHDGSIVDDLLGLDSGAFKLFYTSTSALALLFYAITGFWLWYAPKRIAKLRDNLPISQ